MSKTVIFMLMRHHLQPKLLFRFGQTAFSTKSGIFNIHSIFSRECCKHWKSQWLPYNISWRSYYHFDTVCRRHMYIPRGLCKTCYELGSDGETIMCSSSRNSSLYSLCFCFLKLVICCSNRHWLWWSAHDNGV